VKPTFGIRMSKTNTMVSYLSRIAELKDQLATIETMMEDEELVSIALKGLVSSVGWYVDNGASRHMTYDRSLFNRIQEQEGGMSVELGDDATYPVRGVGSISF
jgi:hypothetical protein